MVVTQAEIDSAEEVEQIIREEEFAIQMEAFVSEVETFIDNAIWSHRRAGNSLSVPFQVRAWSILGRYHALAFRKGGKQYRDNAAELLQEKYSSSWHIKIQHRSDGIHCAFDVTLRLKG